MNKHDLMLIDNANKLTIDEYYKINPALANSIEAKEYLKSVKYKLYLLLKNSLK